jgi:hypothetical protein
MGEPPWLLQMVWSREKSLSCLCWKITVVFQPTDFTKLQVRTLQQCQILEGLSDLHLLKFKWNHKYEGFEVQHTEQ